MGLRAYSYIIMTYWAVLLKYEMKQNGAKWSRNEYEMKRNEDKMKRNEAEWNKMNQIIVKWKWIKRNKNEIKQIMVENEIEVWIPVYMSVCL